MSLLRKWFKRVEISSYLYLGISSQNPYSNVFNPALRLVNRRPRRIRHPPLNSRRFDRITELENDFEDRMPIVSRFLGLTATPSLLEAFREASLSRPVAPYLEDGRHQGLAEAMRRVS